MAEEVKYPFRAGEGSLGKHRAKSKRINVELGKHSLTEKQAKIIKFLREHTVRLGFPPSIREIGDYYGISVKAAHDHLRAIAKKGYIKLFTKRARGIEIVKDPYTSDKNTEAGVKNLHTIDVESELISVPLVGRIAAGTPILAEENVEENLLLPKTFLPYTGNFFALKISGDSMKNAGILDGDIAVIQKVDDLKVEVKNGDIVAALIDSEATLKTYFFNKKVIELCPENEKYTKITLKEKDDPMILGKLAGIYRKY